MPHTFDKACWKCNKAGQPCVASSADAKNCDLCQAKGSRCNRDGQVPRFTNNDLGELLREVYLSYAQGADTADVWDPPTTEVRVEMGLKSNNPDLVEKVKAHLEKKKSSPNEPARKRLAPGLKKAMEDPEEAEVWLKKTIAELRLSREKVLKLAEEHNVKVKQYNSLIEMHGIKTRKKLFTFNV